VRKKNTPDAIFRLYTVKAVLENNVIHCQSPEGATANRYLQLRWPAEWRQRI